MSSNQQFESFALRASSQERRREFALLFFRAFRVQSGTDIGWTKALKSANQEVKVEPISVGLRALKSANQEMKVEPISVPLP